MTMRGEGKHQLSRREVLRSIGAGTIRVHQRLKPGRAITLCWTANTPSSAALISSDTTRSPSGPVSIAFGTSQLPTKPIA